MVRGRKSTKQENRDNKQPLAEAAIEAKETIEDSELKLFQKLADKYTNELNGPRLPGKKVSGMKTAWTYRDMLERFQIISFIPDETLPLTWNGIKVQAIAGIEMHVPKPFFDIYTRHKLALRPRPAPPGIEVDLGAGALT